MIRFYLSELVDAPPARGPAREPAVAVHVHTGWSIRDLRDDSRNLVGQVLVRADVTQAQHLLIVADPRNSEITRRRDLVPGIRVRVPDSWDAPA